MHTQNSLVYLEFLSFCQSTMINEQMVHACKMEGSMKPFICYSFMQGRESNSGSHAFEI